MASGEQAQSLQREARDAVRQPAQKAKRDARQGRGWYAIVARVGLVAKGVSFILVGALAVKLALGDGGKATSRQGALHTVAEHSFGTVVLILLAFGFAAYAIWRFFQAIGEQRDPGDGEAKGDAKKWGKRAAYVGQGLIYAALTWSCIKILMGAHTNGSQTKEAHKRTAEALSLPLGKWIVFAAGAVILGAGLWNVYRALTMEFEDCWRGRGGTVKKWGARLGVLGFLARGFVFGLIGVFVMRAALNYNPKDAVGLDGALQKLVEAPYGPWVLGATAAGLVAYGVFCLFDARYRDVSSNTSAG